MAYSATYLIDGKIVGSAPSALDVAYVLEDGYLLTAMVVDAFCRICADLEPAEHVPSVAETEAAFTGADRYTLRALRRLESAPSVDISMWRKRRYEWRLARTAPARCLKCSGQNFFVIQATECRDPVSGHHFVLHGWELFEPIITDKIRLRPDGTILHSDLDDAVNANHG